MRFLLALALLLAASAAEAAAPQPFERGSFAALKERHAGKPFILHFWGLSCGPCLSELPRWAQFARDYPSLGLALVAADPVPEDPARIEAKLAKAGLGEVESYAFADEFVERLRYEADPKWRGELPYTLLIAGDGTTTMISGIADPARLRAWVASHIVTP